MVNTIFYKAECEWVRNHLMIGYLNQLIQIIYLIINTLSKALKWGKMKMGKELIKKINKFCYSFAFVGLQVKLENIPSLLNMFVAVYK